MYDNADDRQAVNLIESKISQIMNEDKYSDADCTGMLLLFNAREYLLTAESDFERARR